VPIVTEVCLTFDFDAVSLWITTMRQSTATPLSRGEYGARVGVPRILDLLARKSLHATFFTPAHTAVAFPDAVREIQAAGHEIALHGDCHETPVGISATEEAALLDRQIERLSAVLGPNFKPQGYRSPAWDLSEESIGLLQDRGLIYDSSMMADDFRPYLAPRGHTVSAETYARGPTSTIVELPVAWELDDFPYFTFLNKPIYAGLRSPNDVLAIWSEEFDFCNSMEGTFVLTMHPQVIGRGPRIQMLERLIDHMASAGATFRTCADVAADWRTKLLPASTPKP
jgi:peptidoglycan-N-acetylglucosamine deacetylase